MRFYCSWRYMDFAAAKCDCFAWKISIGNAKRYTFDDRSSGRVQRYPLVREVGDAILHYLRKVRPQSRHPEVFLTLKHPHQPLSGGGFGTIVRKRMRRLGLKLHIYGPHSLRHACATHLLSEGFSLKEIGDHLGHVSPVATQMYTKVDLASLREVGEFDLRWLVAYTQDSAHRATPIYPRGDITALRAVAEFSLGGLQ